MLLRPATWSSLGRTRSTLIYWQIRWKWMRKTRTRCLVVLVGVCLCVYVLDVRLVVCVCVRCVRGLCCVLSGFFRVFVLLATLFCVLCVSGVVWCECVFCFVSVSVRACVNVHCVGSVLLLHCVSIARCLGSHRSMHAVCFCFRRRAAFVFPLGRLCCACHFPLLKHQKTERQYALRE